MIDKYLTESDYEEKFANLSTSKQLKFLQTCNNVQNEDIGYIVVADISEATFDGVPEDLCSISKMRYINGEITIMGSISF